CRGFRFTIAESDHVLWNPDGSTILVVRRRRDPTMRRNVGIVLESSYKCQLLDAEDGEVLVERMYAGQVDCNWDRAGRLLACEVDNATVHDFMTGAIVLPPTASEGTRRPIKLTRFYSHLERKVKSIEKEFGTAHVKASLSADGSRVLCVYSLGPGFFS